MKNKISFILVFYILITQTVVFSQEKKAQNPLIFSDVPDMAMLRVGKNYYMSSTTMHMNPGLPIMKSTDLVNWKIINYAYDTLADMPELNLTEGKSTYGRGSWASSLRFHNGTYYVTTFAQTTGETYIFKTKDIDKGNWQRVSFKPAFHDHSLFFDDNGKAYLVYGSGKIKLVELNDDLTGVRPGSTEKVIIENASAPAGEKVGLPSEGSQLFKVNGKYYLYNICWPSGGMRTVVIHRADNINGPWEGKVGFQDMGVAQGGLIDTPDGRWFSYLFKDAGGVGRIPYLVPVKWEKDWPILGENGKVPEYLDLPPSKGLIPGIVNSDEFNRKKSDKDLPLVWQWNHNPDNSLWSVRERKGYLRLKTARIDNSFVQAKNTLTQRTFGPESSATTIVEASKMKEGDLAGLSLLQKEYGLIAVKLENGSKKIVMMDAVKGIQKEIASVALNQDKVYFKAECDFKNKADKGKFYYSLDGIKWISIGNTINMPYTIPHFMGYRFGLFNYATKEIGGYADFDWFRINN